MAKKFIKYIIFSLLALTPIFGLFEYFTSLSGNGEGIYLSQVYSPWWIKGLKDFGLLVHFIFFVLGVLMREINLNTQNFLILVINLIILVIFHINYRICFIANIIGWFKGFCSIFFIFM